MSAPIGFDAMGKPVPVSRLNAGLAALRNMDPTIPTGDAMALIGAVADALERDQPYEAMAACEGHIDLTGAYVLLSTLLNDPPSGRVKP